MLHVHFFSESREIFEGQAAKVFLPAQVGTMEVLPGHVDFVANLAVGEVFVHPNEGALVHTTGGLGVAYKNGENLTILIEEVTIANKLTDTKIAEAKNRARELKESAQTKKEKETASYKHHRSLVDEKVFRKLAKK